MAQHGRALADGNLSRKYLLRSGFATPIQLRGDLDDVFERKALATMAGRLARRIAFAYSAAMTAPAEPVFKITPLALWTAAQQQGRFDGAPVDFADGYIHFSTAAQLRETAAKHFAGQKDLVLIAVDPVLLGLALRWEPSRGGALFPHLYAPLPLDAVLWARPLPLDAEGAHIFPEGL